MVTVIAMIGTAVPVVCISRMPAVVGWVRFAYDRSGNVALHAALDDLVEFAAVKPYPAALRAIIDFDAGAFGHQQIGTGTHGTFHFGVSGMVMVGG